MLCVYQESALDLGRKTEDHARSSPNAAPEIDPDPARQGCQKDPLPAQLTWEDKLSLAGGLAVQLT